MLPLIATLLIYAVVGYSAGRPEGRAGDPSYFIHAGQMYLAPDLLPPDSFIQPTTGYDGQFFFYLAQDPLLQGRAASRDQIQSDHIDNVAYRYQRILLPLVGWVVSWGEPSVLEWTLPLINLAALLGATYLLARFLQVRGRSPWIALVFPTSIGVVVGVVNDLSDPLAAALFLVGVVWWLEHRTAPAVVALTACLLARELYLVPVAAIAAIEVLRDRRRSLPWLVPLGVLALWQLYLRLALTGSPTEGTNPPSLVPLVGAMRKLREVLREDVLGAANWEVLFVGLLLLIWAFFCLRSLEALDRLRRKQRASREHLVPVVALGAVLLIPFLTLELWRNIPSYSRYSAPAAGMLVLSYALRRDLWSRGLMAGVVGLTLTNPVVALLPAAKGSTIEPIPAPPRQQARVDQIIACLDTAGIPAGRTAAKQTDTVTVRVTPRSGGSAAITVFESPRVARERAGPAAAYIRAAGGVAKRVGTEVVAYEKRIPSAEVKRIEACLS